MSEYNQEVKKCARERLIGHAIDSLTKSRNDSFLVSKKHFEQITAHFNHLMHLSARARDFDFHNTYNWLFFGGKQSWLEFYDSICIKKTASELKVLYLSGPEPLNDINVFCDHGIRLENIWALESEKATYDAALKSLQDADIHIKLHKGKLSEFFELVNHEFDIVYFDACSPLIAPKESPLEVLKQLFINKRLTGLSVLITNFAEPGNNYNWGDIMGTWFATKHTYEVPSIDNEQYWETFRKIGYFENYSQHINQHLPSYYDRFITHFISAFAAEIMPMWQMASMGSIQHRYLLTGQSLFEKLKAIRNHQVKVGSLEEMICDTPHFALAVEGYPLLNWVNLTREKLPREHSLNTFLNSKRKFATIDDAIYMGNLLKSYEESYGGFKTFIREICSPQLNNILDRLNFFDRELCIACDIPMKNLLVELLYGLYGFPYIANTEKNLALKYKAKETVMYSNVFVFDQCRYLYDFLPTPDLWESFFTNFANQIIIRGCIDGIRRNHIHLNSALFEWGFIEGINDQFGASELKEREHLI